MTSVDLSVEFAGLTLRNPLVAASGTSGWGTELERIEGFSNELLGALILKSVTLEPRLGNPTPRIVETAGGAGLINAIGLENPGVDKVVADYLPRLADAGTVIIGNAAAGSVEEFAEVAGRLCASPVVQAVEVNISCPNVHNARLPFGTDPAIAASVIAAVRGVTDKPVIAKLTPSVTCVAAIAQACIEAGADALSLANNFGGLSGPAIKPLALKKVHEVYQVAGPAGVPILGGGGIVAASDAVEFLLAGARAFSVGTLMLRQATAVAALLDALRRLVAAQGETRVADLTGGLVLHD